MGTSTRLGIAIMFGLLGLGCSPATSLTPRSDGGPGGPLDPTFGNCAEASDGDGDFISDFSEGDLDLDEDGIPNRDDDDSDGDGIADIDEAGDQDLCTHPADSNADGIPDYIDPDRDNDGLRDGDELTLRTSPDVADTDGDGVLDGVEILAGSDPLDPASRVPGGDYYVVLPYEEPSQERTLEFSARIGASDIFFLIDTTDSMGEEIESIRQSLSTVIVPGVSELVALARMGVGDFRDFPQLPYGGRDDWAFQVRQPVASNIEDVQEALNNLTHGGGEDDPEAQVEAVYRAFSHPCSTGEGYGAACFAEGHRPILVVVTDNETHNGPQGSNPYHFGVKSFDEAVAAVQARDGRILGIAAHADARRDLRALATETGSVNGHGQVIVHDAPGGAVGAAVIDGIVDLIGGLRQDVTTRVRDLDDDAVDATQFVQGARPRLSDENTARGISASDASFLGVPGGSPVEFELEFQNNFVPPTNETQLFEAEVDVIDEATGHVLDTRRIYIVVPPRSASVTLI